jgi:hypothetical protein
VTRWLAGVALVCSLALGACAEAGGGGGGVDPTPERLDGSSSQEFDAGDIARANSASEAVRDYCSGAVSEAQEVGCLSHVGESDLP